MPRKDLDEWILQIGAEMHRFSNEMSPASPKLARQKEWAPRVDVLETAEQVIVRVELAGVRSGQFAIQYSTDRHAMIVRGERFDESSDGSVPMAPHQLEIDYGQFAREIALPDVALAISEAQAQLANGMLTIVVPKDSGEPPQTIIVERTITVRRLK